MMQKSSVRQAAEMKVDMEVDMEVKMKGIERQKKNIAAFV